MPGSADQDTEARAAMWRAIRVASDEVRHRFHVSSILGSGRAAVSASSAVPDVATWQLVEALSLLGVILRSEEAEAEEIGIFGKTGPIAIREDGIVHQLWAQQTLQGDKSTLSGRPDLVVTSSLASPNPNNATRIIETKCVRQLGAQLIRSEFGKAHDLRVATYLIWSFYSPSRRVIDGALGLGINLEPLGFDTERRGDLVRSADALISHIAHAQEQARRGQKFALVLEQAAQAARRKIAPPSTNS